MIRGMHSAFFALGVDVVETASLGSYSVPLGDYGIPERAEELSRTSAALAREVASDFSTPDRPRWVAGSIGPGTKMPTLGHIAFADLRDAYEVQARGLLDGGVDILLIETQYDRLGAKAAMIGGRRAMGASGREVPWQGRVASDAAGAGR